MKKNDDTIQKLFDDYAEELNERADLGQRAMDALVAKNAKKTQQRKPSIWTWLAPVCCALIFAVVSVSIWSTTGPLDGDMNQSGSPNFSGQDSSQSEDDSTRTPVYYALSEVKGRNIAFSDCDDTLKVSQVKHNEEYQVVYERYYAFYFADGTLAYVKAVLGVRSDEGFCEIVIVAEADGVVRDDLRDAYEDYLSGNDRAYMFTNLDDNGEYVTNAFFTARNAHFYVYAMTGANGALAEKIISKIL